MRVNTCTSWPFRSKAAASSVTWTPTPPTEIEWSDSQESIAIRMSHRLRLRLNQATAGIHMIRQTLGAAFRRTCRHQGNSLHKAVRLTLVRISPTKPNVRRIFSRPTEPNPCPRSEEVKSAPAAHHQCESASDWAVSEIPSLSQALGSNEISVCAGVKIIRWCPRNF